MKELSIDCRNCTLGFDETILSLLSRMINLERLHLSPKVYIPSAYIDELYLQNNLQPLFPRLTAFSFFIRSVQFGADRPTNVSFVNKCEANSTYSYEEYFGELKQDRIHVYSDPRLAEYCTNISNRFLGGRFPYVWKITLHDEEPFEHEFFFRIQQSFPLMKK